MTTYRVTSKHRVLGHEPGTVFEDELDPVQEARLLAGGALAVSDEPASEPATNDEE
jgi:hypothetical protein